MIKILQINYYINHKNLNKNLILVIKNIYIYNFIYILLNINFFNLNFKILFSKYSKIIS